MNIPADLLGHLRHLTVGILFQLEHKLNIIVPIPWGHVEMKMKDRLSGDSSIVRENIEAFEVETRGQRLGDRLDSVHDAGEGRRRQGQEIATMVFWNDEGVAVVDRVDVENAESVVVFVEDFRRGMSRNDLAECALNHVVFARIERRKSTQIWF